MPTFFFDIDDGRGLQRDDTGTELTDEQTARREALAILPAIASHRRNVETIALACEVRNETGCRIATTRLTLTVSKGATETDRGEGDEA